jgi:hypothetical protein
VLLSLELLTQDLAKAREIQFVLSAIVGAQNVTKILPLVKAAQMEHFLQSIVRLVLQLAILAQ